jgi:hypothetical protein
MFMLVVISDISVRKGIHIYKGGCSQELKHSVENALSTLNVENIIWNFFDAQPLKDQSVLACSLSLFANYYW